MNTKEFTKKALMTANHNREVIYQRLSVDKMESILHAALGITTEGGELVDQLKKHIYYGKEFDRTNIIEEIGDCLWYLAVLANAVDSSLEEAMEKNIEKLTLRYGKTFSEEKAINRDVEAERKILENN